MSADDIAVDAHGRPLAYSPEQVRSIVNAALHTGTILAVVLMKGNELMVQVLGPPSLALADALDQAARGYRAALKGH